MRSLLPHEPGAGPRLELDQLPELASVAQTAAVMGLTASQVRGLIQSRRLQHVLVGRRPFVPKTAIPRFIADNTVQPCRDETLDPVSGSSKNGIVSTSAGPKLGAAGSAARALQIADSLKLHSRNSSTDAHEQQDRVIPLKSS
jgi:hypothetical protein